MVGSKPKAIEWLEQQTGQRIEFEPDVSPRDRHLSVRLTASQAAGLDALARERGVLMSQLVRDLLDEALADRAAIGALDSRALSSRLAADVAEVRRRLAG